MLAAKIGATLENVTSIGSNAGLVLRALENRAALATLELESVRKEAGRTFVFATIGMVLTLLAGISVTFVVAAIYWDTPHRVLSLVILGGVELVVALVAMSCARHLWLRCRPLEHTRDQLAKDSACLREMFTRNN